MRQIGVRSLAATPLVTGLVRAGVHLAPDRVLRVPASSTLLVVSHFCGPKCVLGTRPASSGAWAVQVCSTGLQFWFLPAAIAEQENSAIPQRAKLVI